MNIMEEIRLLIERSLPGSQVTVTDLTGTQDHLGIQVIAAIFKGKMLIEQHQMIMDILKEKLKKQIHAVQIKTMVPKNSEESL